MNQECFEKELLTACTQMPPDFVRIKKLLESKEEAQALDLGSFLSEVILDFPCDMSSCDDDEQCSECSKKKMENLPELIQLLGDAGLISAKAGARVLNSLLYAGFSEYAFQAARLICKDGIECTNQEYEQLLEGIGLEESYQRCCEKNHIAENLIFACYEAVLNMKKGGSFADIDTYCSAIGMTVERIVLFGTDDDLFSDAAGRRCFSGDIGFVCGEKALIITDGINVYAINRIWKSMPYMDCDDLFGMEFVDNTIQSIWFSHRNIMAHKTEYGQASIHIRFTGGKEIRFTHNFGEIPENKAISRFEITVEAQEQEQSIARESPA